MLSQYQSQTLVVHLKELAKRGLLKRDELKKLLARTREFAKKQPDQNIFAFIDRKFRALGAKARQATTLREQNRTAERLFLKDNLLKIRKHCRKLAGLFLTKASKLGNQSYEKSTAAHYLLSFTDKLISDIALIDFTLKHLDLSPLGAVDGYGTEVLLDRDRTARELGLRKPQINSLAAVHSSKKINLLYLQTLEQILTSLETFTPKAPKLGKSLTKNTTDTLTFLSTTNKQLSRFNTRTKAKPQAKISLGAPGNLDIHYYKNRLKKI